MTTSVFKTTIPLGQAAAMIGVSPPTLRKYAREKKIAHYKLGKRFRFTEGAINEFIQRNMVKYESDLGDASATASE